MVSGDVTYTLSALKRAGFVGGGRQMVLETSGDQGEAITAYGEAILEANDAMEARIAEEVFGRVDAPVQTPQGPMAYVAECEPARALPMLLDLLVEGLERRGISGKLRPGREFWHPVFDEQSFPCLGLLIEPSVDLERHFGAYDPHGRIVIGWGSWDASPPDPALVSRLVDWTLDVRGPVTVRLRATQFEVDAASAPEFVISSLSSERHLSVTRTPSDRARRTCGFDPSGIVVTSFDLDVPRQQHVDELLGLATALGSAAAMTLVRETTTGVHEAKRLGSSSHGIPHPRVLGASVVHHLLADYVYDAGVGQVLTGSQLAKANLPPERWRVEQTGPDRFLVVHREPERWFNPHRAIPDDRLERDAFADQGLVDQARSDFGDAILTPETLARHPGPLAAAHLETAVTWLRRRSESAVHTHCRGAAGTHISVLGGSRDVER